MKLLDDFSSFDEFEVVARFLAIFTNYPPEMKDRFFGRLLEFLRI